MNHATEGAVWSDSGSYGAGSRDDERRHGMSPDRIAVDAAIAYVEGRRTGVRLDRKSCRFWASFVLGARGDA